MLRFQNRTITDCFLQKWPGITFIQKDLENLQASHNKKRLSGYTAIQTFIKRLNNHKTKYIVRYVQEDPDQMLSFLWTYLWCETMQKRFQQVFHFDNIYNTNRFKMVFFEVVVFTNLGTVAFIYFVLIDNERQEGFNWLVNQLDTLRNQSGIPAPKVVITNYKPTLKNVLTEIFEVR